MQDLKKSKYKWLGVWGVHTLKPGVAHEAIRFVDFDCMPESFRGILYQAAALRGLKATAVVIGNSVIFSFYKPEGYMRPNMPAYPVVRRMRGLA